jgi:hypothetical protein
MLRPTGLFTFGVWISHYLTGKKKAG